MAYNHVNSNLCNNTEIILENYKAMRANQKYLSDSSLHGNVRKDTLEKNSEKTNIAGDGSDDGKISFKEKVKNFGKGLIAPVKNMFSSPKNIAITAVSAAAGVGLIALTSGAAAPVMVATGLIFGGVQIGKGIYKQVNAKTDEEAKQAWQEMGSGTFTAGVSAASAKPALKASGVDTKGMSVFAAIGKCLKDTPKNIVKCGSSIAGKFSSAADSVSQAVKAGKESSNSSSGSSDPVQVVEGEVIDAPSNRPVNKKPAEYIDVEFTEVIDETDTAAGVQAQIAAVNEPLKITAKSEKPKLNTKSEPLRLQEGQKPLLLEAHNPDTTQKASPLQKIKNLLKVFGFFKPKD